MEIFEKDIATCSSSLSVKPENKREKGKNKADDDSIKWEDIELQAINVVPTEVDITKIERLERPERDDKQPRTFKEKFKKIKKNRSCIALAKDVAVVTTVRTIGSCLMFPLLPVAITVDYFSANLGEKFRNGCYKYKQGLEKVGDKVEAACRVKLFREIQ